MSNKYYITTAIVYASGKPHIGNMYGIVFADVIARYQRLLGKEVVFQTGTDEHGEKIEIQAQKHQLAPQVFVDKMYQEVKELYDQLNISYDSFIRTTASKHKVVIQDIYKKLYDKGDIYNGTYTGYYCTPCESFWTESQLVEGRCPDCGREVSLSSEEVLFFKLSKYQDRLLEYYNNHPDFILPLFRKQEMINSFIKPGLQDLSVSRTSFKWGIPLDKIAEGHVSYVWLDALANYITGIGYDVANSKDSFFKLWPADLQVLGKDVLRFHCIYWPILLMALDLPLPKQIFAHPWLLFDGGKMSKSLGNVMYSDVIIKHLGVDAARHYLLSEVPFGQDGIINWQLLIEKVNTDLANVLGNLVNRTLAMVNKYQGGEVIAPVTYMELDEELISMVEVLPKTVDDFLSKLEVQNAIQAIFAVLRRSNKYIDETTPWLLAKTSTDQKRLATVLYNLVESIRFSAVLLQAFLPSTAEKILNQINTKARSLDSLSSFGQLEPSLKIVSQPQPIFNRIDKEKILTAVMPQIKEQKMKPEISFTDFEKIQLMVGTVIDCERHPDADRLLVLKIDLGSKVVQVVSSIADNFTPEALLDKKLVIVSNLKPTKIRGILSEAMILVGEEAKIVELVGVENLVNGTEIN